MSFTVQRTNDVRPGPHDGSVFMAVFPNTTTTTATTSATTTTTTTGNIHKPNGTVTYGSSIERSPSLPNRPLPSLQGEQRGAPSPYHPSATTKTTTATDDCFGPGRRTAIQWKHTGNTGGSRFLSTLLDLASTTHEEPDTLAILTFELTQARIL